jgi:hypothetical protein
MSNEFSTFAPIFENGTLYLGFLHFESDDLPQAVALVRDACARSKNPSEEIESLLTDDGWREHLVAATALLVREELSCNIAAICLAICGMHLIKEAGFLHSFP